MISAAAGEATGRDCVGRAAATTVIIMAVTLQPPAATPIPVTTLQAMWGFILYTDGGGDQDSMAADGTARVAFDGSNSSYGTQKKADTGVPPKRGALFLLGKTYRLCATWRKTNYLHGETKGGVPG